MNVVRVQFYLAKVNNEIWVNKSENELMCGLYTLCIRNRK